MPGRGAAAVPGKPGSPGRTQAGAVSGAGLGAAEPMEPPMGAGAGVLSHP